MPNRAPGRTRLLQAALAVLLIGLLLGFFLGGYNKQPPPEDPLEKASAAYDKGLYIEAVV